VRRRTRRGAAGCCSWSTEGEMWLGPRIAATYCCQDDDSDNSVTDDSTSLPKASFPNLCCLVGREQGPCLAGDAGPRRLPSTDVGFVASAGGSESGM
jgi:hypothetical protein